MSDFHLKGSKKLVVAPKGLGFPAASFQRKNLEVGIVMIHNDVNNKVLRGNLSNCRQAPCRLQRRTLLRYTLDDEPAVRRVLQYSSKGERSLLKAMQPIDTEIGVIFSVRVSFLPSSARKRMAVGPGDCA